MNNFFLALLLFSLSCIIIFIIQILTNLVKKHPAKKSFIKLGLSTALLIISFLGFGFTTDTSHTDINSSGLTMDDLSPEDSEPISVDEQSSLKSETESVSNSEPISDKTETQGVTDLFQEVYLPYANREKPFAFSLVKQFAQNTNYEIDITEPSSEELGTITLTAANGDYVWFSFRNINDIEIIMTVSYFQLSSDSEVSLSNYSDDGSPLYDIYQTHVLGEPISNVTNTQEQQAFLFE